MTFESIHHHAGGIDHATTGWMVSFLLHGSLALGAILFVHRIHLAPQPEPFTWNVAMVAPAPRSDSTPTSVRQPSPSKKQVATAPISPPSPAAPVSQNMIQNPITPLPLPQPIAETPTQLPVQSAPESIARALPNPQIPAVPMIDAVTKKPDAVEAQPAAGASAHDPEVPTRSTEPPIPAPHREFVTNAPSASVAKIESLPHTAPEPGPQVAALAPTSQSKTSRSDYEWLSDLMARWIEDLDKRYPAPLRADGIQGKVTLMAILHSDGILSDVRIAKSSGNVTLDQVAVEDVENGPPIKLSRALERPQMPVKFSIIYDLKTAR